MRTLTILVKDSYHTVAIASSLQKFYGDKVKCFVSISEDQKFDIFFLSAKEILIDGISPNDIKRELGTNDAKVVAVSTMTEYLDDIQSNPSLGVDFVLAKQSLTSGVGARINPPDTVLNNILDSFS